MTAGVLAPNAKVRAQVVPQESEPLAQAVQPEVEGHDVTRQLVWPRKWEGAGTGGKGWNGNEIRDLGSKRALTGCLTWASHGLARTCGGH